MNPLFSVSRLVYKVRVLVFFLLFCWFWRKWWSIFDTQSYFLMEAGDKSFFIWSFMANSVFSSDFISFTSSVFNSCDMQGGVMIFIHHSCNLMMNFIHALPSDLFAYLSIRLIFLLLLLLQQSVMQIVFKFWYHVMIINNHHLSAEVAYFDWNHCRLFYSPVLFYKFPRVYQRSSFECCHLPMVSNVQNLSVAGHFVYRAEKNCKQVLRHS